MTSLKRPELLAPAGSPERLQTALTYGADAVYLGGSELNLRAQAVGFTWDELDQALEQTKAQNRRLYYCLNILPRPEQMPLVREHLHHLVDRPLDALILADPGVLDLARSILPRVPVHLSTQANTGNAAAAKFWSRQGVSRLNLARELDLSALRSIRQEVRDVELEVFVHGAMCMAVSGRCLMSAYLSQRSANQGLCTHPCRFAYRPYGLEEAKRPGEITWEIVEDSFSALLASEDLALIDFLAWMVKVGLDSLKIEGRMKTSSYLAQVVDVYATALSDLRERSFRPQLYWQELGLTATRPLCTGFFLPGRRKRLFTPGSQQPRAPVLAKVLAPETDGVWSISVRHQWSAEEPITLLVPGLGRPVVQPGEYGLESEDGHRVQVLNSGQQGRLRLDHPDVRTGLMLRRAIRQAP